MMLKKYENMAFAEVGLKDDMANHRTTFAYVVHDKTSVLDGTQSHANYEYVREHGLDLHYLATAGGVTVLYEGNLSTGFVGYPGWVSSTMSAYIAWFLGWLKSKGLNAYPEGNDILVDGYKVCAFSTNYNKETNWGLATITFTVNIDVDLVRSVCNKPMEKVPKGLSEYGITVEDIMNNVVLPFAERH